MSLRKPSFHFRNLTNSLFAWPCLGTGKLRPEEEEKQALVVVGLNRLKGSKSDAVREETRFLTRNSDPKSSGLR